MTSQIHAILDQFYKGLFERKGEIDRALLHDDFTFQDPIEKAENPHKFIAGVKNYGEVIKAVNVIKRYIDNDSACVIYELTTTFCASTILVVEFFRFKDNKIINLQACYDPREFLKQFAKLNQS